MIEVRGMRRKRWSGDQIMGIMEMCNCGGEGKSVLHNCQGDLEDVVKGFTCRSHLP